MGIRDDIRQEELWFHRQFHLAPNTLLLSPGAVVELTYDGSYRAAVLGLAPDTPPTYNGMVIIVSDSVVRFKCAWCIDDRDVYRDSYPLDGSDVHPSRL